MKRRHTSPWVAIALATTRGSLAFAEVVVKLGGGAGGIEGLKAVPTSGIITKTEMIASADAGSPALKVTFKKTDEARRFLALETRPKSYPVGARVVALRYRLQLTRGEAPRFALLIYEAGGGAWFKVGGSPAATGTDFADARIAVTTLRPAAFAEDTSGQLEWDRIEKVLVGLVFDSTAEGTFELSQARFTSELYKPTGPLRLTGAGPGVWSLGADAAVQGKVTTPGEGPDGKPCMKFEWSMPGRRHMYALPATPMPSAELEGYTGLRLTYRATLPPGINGLLVSLVETGGGHYYADPAPPASADWTTITIPFDRFRFGTWSKDPNGKLDVDQVGSVLVGMHGTSTADPTDGIIWAADIEFVP